MLEVYEDLLNDWIEQAIAADDDDHLFATGYLQGHISVAFSKLEASEDVSLEQFFAAMEEAFHEARTELGPEDYQLVKNVWQEIQAHFNAHAEHLHISQ